jgi:hypothetical protein
MRILLHFFHFDVLKLATTNLLFKCHFISFQIIHLNIICSIIFLGNSHRSRWIVIYYHWYNVVHCYYACLF